MLLRPSLGEGDKGWMIRKPEDDLDAKMEPEGKGFRGR
jgi:hypothetical protein